MGFLKALGASFVLVGLGASCQTGGVPVSDLLLERQPRSILVLPPLDETLETNAIYGAYSSVTIPLAESGYYVFPVALVNAIMLQNGLPTPYEMHSVPLSKLVEIFDPDAVLYLTVTDWGTSYQVLNSATTISMTGRLVDADTGALLWEGDETLQQNSNSGGGGLAGMLVGALVNQVTTSISDPSRDIARSANWNLLTGRARGWILGPYHPDVEADLTAIREARPPG